MTEEQADRIVGGVKKARLTELEAREIGDKAFKVQRLRSLLQSHCSGKVVIERAPNCTESLSLTVQDMAAVLRTLLDRDTNWLIAMNVEVDQ